MQQPSGQGFSLDAIRRTVEDKVLEAVDGVCGRIPHGEQYKEQFHSAIDSTMDNLQRQAQSQIGNLGGMPGNISGQQGNQPNPPRH